MVSPLSHLEMGPSLSGWILVEGKWDNQCETFRRYKSFEPMGVIVVFICMGQEAAISA